MTQHQYRAKPMPECQIIFCSRMQTQHSFYPIAEILSSLY